MVTDLLILTATSPDASRWQQKPIGRALWHSFILDLNKILHLRLTSARKDKMDDSLLAVERWMKNLEWLPKTAGPQDLNESRGHFGRLQLKDILTNQLSA
jgi:hypothetical protein